MKSEKSELADQIESVIFLCLPAIDNRELVARLIALEVMMIVLHSDLVKEDGDA